MPSMKYRSVLAAFGLGLVTALTALPAAAQYRNAEAAIKYRQSAMALQGNHMGRLGAMIKGDVPFDAKVAAENIEITAVLNRLQFAAFVDGSDKGNTKAKPEIWENMDDFKAKLEKMQQETAKIAEVAQSGDFNALKAQVGETGKACKACHDKYRNK